MRDRHCGRPGCACTHEYGCFRGWIDLTDSEGLTRASPCQTCRPDLARRVRSVPAPGLRDEGDLAVLKNVDRTPKREPYK